MALRSRLRGVCCPSVRFQTPDSPWQPVNKDRGARAVPLVVELRFLHRIGDYCDTFAASRGRTKIRSSKRGGPGLRQNLRLVEAPLGYACAPYMSTEPGHDVLASDWSSRYPTLSCSECGAASSSVSLLLACQAAQRNEPTLTAGSATPNLFFYLNLLRVKLIRHLNLSRHSKSEGIPPPS